MATYTIHEASLKKSWNGQYGPMRVLNLTLQEDGKEPIQCEWRTKGTPEDPLPQPGSRADFDVTQGQYGLEARKPQQQQSAGGRGGRSPEENRRIVRQHSQDMAIRWAEFAHARGKLPDEFKLSDLVDLTERFHKDAMEGGQ